MRFANQSNIAGAKNNHRRLNLTSIFLNSSARLGFPNFAKTNLLSNFVHFCFALYQQLFQLLQGLKFFSHWIEFRVVSIST